VASGGAGWAPRWARAVGGKGRLNFLYSSWSNIRLSCDAPIVTIEEKRQVCAKAGASKEPLTLRVIYKL
jgi:hypothetical protein